MKMNDITWYPSSGTVPVNYVITNTNAPAGDKVIIGNNTPDNENPFNMMDQLRSISVSYNSDNQYNNVNTVIQNIPDSFLDDTDTKTSNIIPSFSDILPAFQNKNSSIKDSQNFHGKHRDTRYKKNEINTSYDFSNTYLSNTETYSTNENTPSPHENLQSFSPWENKENEDSKESKENDKVKDRRYEGLDDDLSEYRRLSDRINNLYNQVGGSWSVENGSLSGPKLSDMNNKKEYVLSGYDTNISGLENSKYQLESNLYSASDEEKYAINEQIRQIEYKIEEEKQKKIQTEREEDARIERKKEEFEGIKDRLQSVSSEISRYISELENNPDSCDKYTIQSSLNNLTSQESSLQSELNSAVYY